MFARSTDDRLVAGVCGGLARRLGVDPVLLRAATVVLTLAGGAGIVAYLLAWSLAADDADPLEREPTAQQGAAVGLVVLGLLLLLRDVGLWFGDSLVLPVLVASVGAVVIWARSAEDDRARLAGLARRVPGDPLRAALGGPTNVLRTLTGAGLLAAGITALLAANDAVAALRSVLLAVILTMLGATLVFGRWVARLARQIGDEREQRIRTEERAEVAAHLHDSVLQTLTLIQRQGDQPRRMAALARSQERELRAWLYGRGTVDPADASLRDLLEAAVADVEASHEVEVEVVVVGDRPGDDDVVALVAAVREALVNVGRHAGVGEAAVFVEVEPSGATAFVRDRGRGFDPAAVPQDRHGIAHSVRGRLRRHGGRATLVTEPGHGAEWELWLPPGAAVPAGAAERDRGGHA